jgi:long-chain fatty acid transport protein
MDPGTTTVRFDRPAWAGFAGFSTDLNRSDMVIAAGLYAPYGLVLDWPDDGPQRYSVTTADLKTIFFTPSFAYRVSDRLSVGAGFSFIFADAEIQKSNGPSSDPTNPLFMDPEYDIDVTVDGDDFDVGADLGLRYELREDLTWGFLYISEVNLDLEGNFTAIIPPTLVDQFGGADRLTDAGQVDLTLPHQVRTGIYWGGIDRLGLEFDFTWLNWSSTEAIVFDFDNTTALTSQDKTLSRDWSNSVIVQIGAEYQINPDLMIRGGYIFDQTPVPDKTLDPVLPQADKNIYTVGAGYRINAISFDISYAYLMSEDRTTTNSIHDFPTNGHYATTTQILAFSSGYSF